MRALISASFASVSPCFPHANVHILKLRLGPSTRLTQKQTDWVEQVAQNLRTNDLLTESALSLTPGERPAEIECPPNPGG